MVMVVVRLVVVVLMVMVEIQRIVKGKEQGGRGMTAR